VVPGGNADVFLIKSWYATPEMELRLLANRGAHPVFVSHRPPQHCRKLLHAVFAVFARNKVLSRSLRVTTGVQHSALPYVLFSRPSYARFCDEGCPGLRLPPLAAEVASQHLVQPAGDASPAAALPLGVDPQKVIYHGFLTKEGHWVKNWKRRLFVLDAENLSYYDGDTMCGSLKVASITHVEATSGPAGRCDGIGIYTSGGKYLRVQPADHNARARWADAIAHARAGTVPFVAGPSDTGGGG
jgi:hypothetical protein